MSLDLNKYKIRAGDHVILDKKFRNGSEVAVVRIGTVFATVKSLDPPYEEWDTMINRLTPLEPVE